MMFFPFSLIDSVAVDWGDYELIQYSNTPHPYGMLLVLLHLDRDSKRVNDA